MKRKLCLSFIPYCDVCSNKTASQMRKHWVGFDFIHQEVIGQLNRSFLLLQSHVNDRLLEGRNSTQKSNFVELCKR